MKMRKIAAMGLSAVMAASMVPAFQLWLMMHLERFTT